MKNIGSEISYEGMSSKGDFVTSVVKQWERERPDLKSWPSGIAGRLLRLATHVRKLGEEVVQPLGLTWETFEMLAALRRQGAPFAMNPTALYKSVLLTSGAMTARLDRAEKAGFIARSNDPNDRRGVIVSLTKEGKKVADEAISRYFARIEVVLGPMGDHDLREITRLLSFSLEAMEQASIE